MSNEKQNPNNNNKKTEKKPKQWRTPFIISLSLNVIFAICIALGILITIEYLNKTTDERYIVNEGLTMLCSDKFQNLIREGHKGQANWTDTMTESHIAYNKLICQQDEATQSFFQESYENYLESLGLPRDGGFLDDDAHLNP